ncbi:MAG: putative serine peptidase, partial [Planctomycetaceae bacterium]|nr:putative serine peptidase [Planctomycetaceae bacterium]
SKATNMPLTHFDIEFTKDGNVFEESQVKAALQAAPDFTDLIVIAHGWNEDMTSAQQLYDAMFESVDAVLPRKENLSSTKVGVIRIYWPSKRFADAGLIPGGNASVNQTESETALRRLLEELKRDPQRLGGNEIDPERSAKIDAAISVIDSLGDDAAKETFLKGLRGILNPKMASPDDASDDFFRTSSVDLFKQFDKPVIAPPAVGAGGAADVGGATGLRDILSGVTAAARRLANYVTYYQMKERAGLVGEVGVQDVIRRLHDTVPAVRIHVVGHSFGARLVTSAIQSLPSGVSVSSMTLLQAAFSHNGLAHNFDGQDHDGFFRKVITDRRVTGPIVITYTKNDEAVGIAYPLASRIAGQNSAMLGDRNDPYGGLGRNGAQHTSEVDDGEAELLDEGHTYAFQLGHVYNLLSDKFISGHSAVTGSQVVNALLDAITTEAFLARSKVRIGDLFARVMAPRQLNDPAKRRQWGLPTNDTSRGPYIIELNMQHISGLPGAIVKFLDLYKKATEKTSPSDETKVLKPKKPSRKKGVEEKTTEPVSGPVRISKSYYRCELSVKEWRELLKLDENNALQAAHKAAETRSNALKAAGNPIIGNASDLGLENADQYRSIFRLWPDFPIKAQLYQSIPTIKADAALRSFEATGRGIVWAVIDSGVQADHPHFGTNQDAADHVLKSVEVRDLHRCFVGLAIPNSKELRFLDDPDLAPLTNINDPDELEAATRTRDQIVTQHREAALTDDFGHGTHVAGIIAGRAPLPVTGTNGRPAIIARAIEHQFRYNEQTEKVDSRFSECKLDELDRTHGVAMQCKLVSLRVLDKTGNGRSSDVIRALEYIRENINDDRRLMRVHGVNLSVGYEFDPEMFACGQSPLCVTVDRLVQSGVVVIAAAGNTGSGTVAADVRATRVGLSNTINDPGNAALAITVGSTHPEKPHTYGISYFSSKGPTADGRLKPDLVAPGERILSCAAGSKLASALTSISRAQAASAPNPPAPALPAASDGQLPPPGPVNVAESVSKAYYIEDSGTSMAAPHVSGAVAAFLSIRREFIGNPEEVKRIFLESASPLGRERYFEGHGLLDLMRAIQSV